MVYTAQEDISAHLEPTNPTLVLQVLIIPMKELKVSSNAAFAHQTHSTTFTALKVANLVVNSPHQKKKPLFALALALVDSIH